MGDFTNEIRISKIPIKSSLNWTEIHQSKKKLCENCGSDEMVCIFESTSGCIIGWTIEQEYFCKDCKHYILYITEYES